MLNASLIASVKTTCHTQWESIISLFILCWSKLMFRSFLSAYRYRLEMKDLMGVIILHNTNDNGEFESIERALSQGLF